MLRQYFMALLTVGKWKNLPQHWVNVVEKCETPISPIRTTFDFPSIDSLRLQDKKKARSVLEEKMTEDVKDPWNKFLQRRFSINVNPHNENLDSCDSDDEGDETPDGSDDENRLDFEILLMRKFWTLWALKAGVKASVCDPLKEGAFTVDWTRCIAPVTEGRIKMVET